MPKIQFLDNPYSGLLTTRELIEIVEPLLQEVETKIRAGFETGEYQQESGALCVLKPTLTRFDGNTQEAVFLLALIGPGGGQWLPHAIRKTLDLRAYDGLSPQRLPERRPQALLPGTFIPGGAVIEGGTYGGFSGLLPVQDYNLMQGFLTSLNLELGARITMWRQQYPDAKWLGETDSLDQNTSRHKEAMLLAQLQSDLPS